MIKVKGEFYRDDFHRKNFVKDFSSLDGLYEWLNEENAGRLHFGRTSLQTFYIGTSVHPRLNNGNVSDCDWENVKYVIPDEPCRLEVKADNNRKIWIYQIESEKGIEFSSGKMTNGKKFQSERFKEWSLKKTKETFEPNLQFAVDGEKPKEMVQIGKEDLREILELGMQYIGIVAEDSIEKTNLSVKGDDNLKDDYFAKFIYPANYSDMDKYRMEKFLGLYKLHFPDNAKSGNRYFDYTNEIISKCRDYKDCIDGKNANRENEKGENGKGM